MKRFKMFALLGSLTIASACMPAVVLADEAAKASDGPPQSMLDLGASGERGMRLDELFAAFKNDKPSAKTGEKQIAAPKSGTSKSVAHANPVVHKKPVVATASKKPTVSAPHPTNENSEVAVYKHANNDGGGMVAVSHTVISNGTTPVIEASLDKPGTVPKYKVGDHMVIKLKAVQDCNVMVFDFDNHGTLTQIYPNDYDSSGSLAAGQTVELGGDSSQYNLTVGGDGMERIFVYTYPKSEGPLTVAMNPIPHTPFRSVNITAEQYDRMVHNSRSYFNELEQRNGRFITVEGKDKLDKLGRAQQVENDSHLAPVSSSSSKPANKVELTFQIEK